jgi:excisionase family DNA binding protein
VQNPEQPYRLTFTVAEAATMLGVSQSTIYAMVKRDEIASLRFGDRRVIPRIVLEQLLGEKIEIAR